MRETLSGTQESYILIGSSFGQTKRGRSLGTPTPFDSAHRIRAQTLPISDNSRVQTPQSKPAVLREGQA